MLHDSDCSFDPDIYMTHSLVGDTSQFRAVPNRGMVRGRGCNDSFRAAVDRSYDGPVQEQDPMETRKCAKIIFCQIICYDL